MWFHFVFRASTPYQPFQAFEEASRTWRGLSESFPEMIAAVLMPNHAHLILPQTSQSDEMRAYKKLGGIMARISKSQRIPGYWQPIPQPRLISTRSDLRRQIRYVALNPCRKTLCSDPLEWYWSTYREIMGGVIRPTVRADRISSLVGESQAKFRVRFHAYVSGDPSVKVEGTPLPVRLNPDEFRYFSLHQILAAAAASLRVPETLVQTKGTDLRPLFIHLASRCGWNKDSGRLAEICGMSPRSVRSTLQTPAPLGIECAELCLSDKRLVQARGAPPK